MYGTFAVSESPLAGVPGSSALSVAGVGRATVESSAQGRGFVVTVYSTAPGRGHAVSSAVARGHVEQEVRVAGRTCVTATAAAVGRLEIGNVIARWKTEPLPIPKVQTEPLGIVQHLYGFPAEDNNVTVSVVPVVTKVSTCVMEDVQVSTSLSDE